MMKSTGWYRLSADTAAVDRMSWVARFCTDATDIVIGPPPSEPVQYSRFRQRDRPNEQGALRLMLGVGLGYIAAEADGVMF